MQQGRNKQKWESQEDRSSNRFMYIQWTSKIDAKETIPKDCGNNYLDTQYKKPFSTNQSNHHNQPPNSSSHINNANFHQDNLHNQKKVAQNVSQPTYAERTSRHEREYELISKMKSNAPNLLPRTSCMDASKNDIKPKNIHVPDTSDDWVSENFSAMLAS